ncbi:MAG: bifunctional 4-hydroxy-2-oxoglutarate aldolase/2-dehydro-3-deoxy-phosphogluconate aldolase [Oscillospiraceae bacterium]|nr:bifunctional 4-hydroxy-2-oxoglutarate aldolase/2-dehydro-3-deoxy-phosphogluconate aldolase [Oscillospiraceae bacterium]
MSNTFETLKQNKIIAIVRGISSDKIVDLANALSAGGIKCIEVTFDQSSPEGIQETVRSIKCLAEMGGDICVGAGTVMSVEQVQMAYESGAKYIISPNLNEAVIKETKRLGMVSIPGAFTPTEAAYAYECGADIVKIFPGGLLGTAYIKALKAPLSYIPLTAVGNVNQHNCADFIKAGCVGVGVGGSLVSKDLVNEGRFDEITAMAKEYMDALA